MADIAKVITIIGSSPESFAKAADAAVQEASKTLRGITGAHVTSMSAEVTDGKTLAQPLDVLQRQGFRHACKECGVGSQAFRHLYHAICRVYADQLRLRPIGIGSTQQFSCSTADIKDAHRLMDDTCCQGKRRLMCPIKKGSLQPGIFIGTSPLIEALYVFLAMFCCHTCISFPNYLRFAPSSCCWQFSHRCMCERYGDREPLGNGAPTPFLLELARAGVQTRTGEDEFAKEGSQTNLEWEN